MRGTFREKLTGIPASLPISTQEKMSRHFAGIADCYEGLPEDVVTIAPKDLAWIPGVVKSRSYRKALEIGCAYGGSSEVLAESLKQADPRGHLVICDPVQSTVWKSAGTSRLRAKGLANFTLLELVSELALPMLLSEHAALDLVFVDGFHSYGQVAMELYYIDRLLVIGGTVVLDDYHWDFPGVTLAVDTFLTKGCSGNYRFEDHGRLVELQKTSATVYREN